MSQTRTFFATKADLTPGVKQIELSISLTYIEHRWYETQSSNTFASAFQIPDFGLNKTGDHSTPQFWVRKNAFRQIVRMKKITFRDKRSGPKMIRYEPKISAMLDGISVSFGGMYGEDSIIDGHFGHVDDNSKARQLFELFNTHLLANFTQRENVYIGPDALKLHNDKGVRLVHFAHGESIL